MLLQSIENTHKSWIKTNFEKLIEPRRITLINTKVGARFGSNFSPLLSTNPNLLPQLYFSIFLSFSYDFLQKFQSP